MNRLFQIFIVVIGLYILLVAKALLWIYQNNHWMHQSNDYYSILYFASNDSQMMLLLPTSTQQQTSSWWAQQQYQPIVLRGGDFKRALGRRAYKRLQRTRPPLTASHQSRDGDAVFSDWYSMTDTLMNDEEPRGEVNEKVKSLFIDDSLLNKDQLCCPLAKDEFDITPNYCFAAAC